MKTSELKITYQDYLLIQDTDKRYELYDGRLYMVPAPIPYHQEIVGNLFGILKSYVKSKALGEVFIAPCDVVLTEVDVVQPDLFFISKERSHIITEKNISGPPDLVVEIISKNIEYRDRLLKRKLYAHHKVKEYWIVDPEAKTVEVLILKGRAYKTRGIYTKKESFESELLKGLEVRGKDVF
jgi:Uma2 family endonuclease